MHVLDEPPAKTPNTMSIEIIQKLRDVQNFDSVDALKKQIQKDIDEARAILKTC